MQSSLAAAKAPRPAIVLGHVQADQSPYDAPFDSGQHVAMLSLEALNGALVFSLAYAHRAQTARSSHVRRPVRRRLAYPASSSRASSLHIFRFCV